MNDDQQRRLIHITSDTIWGFAAKIAVSYHKKCEPFLRHPRRSIGSDLDANDHDLDDLTGRIHEVPKLETISPISEF